MAELKQIRIVKFPTYSIGEYVVDPFVTTNGTEQVIGQLPVPQNQNVDVLEYSADANSSDFLSTIKADLTAAFLRATGNLERTSTSASTGLIRNVFTKGLGLGSNTNVGLDATANNDGSIKYIDFKATGKTGITLNWSFFFRIKFTNPAE